MEMAIFSSSPTFEETKFRGCMAVLVTYSKSLRAHDSSEPFLDDM
jgi:hypothetical protein